MPLDRGGSAKKENPFPYWETGAGVQHAGTRQSGPRRWYSGPCREARMPTVFEASSGLRGWSLDRGLWPCPSREIPVNNGRLTPNTAARLRRIPTVFRFSKGPQIK